MGMRPSVGTTFSLNNQRLPHSGPTCTRKDAAKARKFPSHPKSVGLQKFALNIWHPQKPQDNATSDDDSDDDCPREV